MTHPSGTLGFNHLLIAADAELALVPEADVYLGKAYKSSQMLKKGQALTSALAVSKI
jgi:hypothetical protein